MPHTDPPWRLDPFQMPVNINWEGGPFIAIDSGDIGFGWETFNGNGYPMGSTGGFHVYMSKDGRKWEVVLTGGGNGETGVSNNYHETGSVTSSMVLTEYWYGQILAHFSPYPDHGYWWEETNDTRGHENTPSAAGAFNGVGVYVTFGGGTYIVAGYYIPGSLLGDSGGQNAQTPVSPLFYKSNDGKKWTQFKTVPVVGISTTAGGTPIHAPAPQNCWYDDGGQRTVTTDSHGNLIFDGRPTQRWYSSGGRFEPSFPGIGPTPLWTSTDLQHWHVDTHHVFGLNPGTNKTDDVYVGYPNAGNFGSTPSFGMSPVTKLRTGIYIWNTSTSSTGEDSFYPLQIQSGLTGDPRYWPSYNAPIPSEAMTLTTTLSASFPAVEQVDYQNALNQLAGFESGMDPGTIGLWNDGQPDSQPDQEQINEMYVFYNQEIAYLESQIPPQYAGGGPVSYTPGVSLYANAAAYNEGNGGTFVTVGYIYQDGIQICGFILHSQDGQNWTAVTAGDITGVKLDDFYYQETVQNQFVGGVQDAVPGNYCYCMVSVTSGYPGYKQSFPTIPIVQGHP